MKQVNIRHFIQQTTKLLKNLCYFMVTRLKLFFALCIVLGWFLRVPTRAHTHTHTPESLGSQNMSCQAHNDQTRISVSFKRPQGGEGRDSRSLLSSSWSSLLLRVS